MVVKVPKKTDIRHMAAKTGRLFLKPYCTA